MADRCSKKDRGTTVEESGETEKMDVGESASGEFIETDGSPIRFSIREEAPPEKTMIGYKVFAVFKKKPGQLFPPMVANPGGASTPVGVWLNADAAPRAEDSKTGRPRVQAGGSGTNAGKQTLAYRPGWHLGEVPQAMQFNTLNRENGKKELFPENFVWAECEFAADVDYQQEAESYGYNAAGNFQHSLAGLPRIPANGFYKYRTNPDPKTEPWFITGAMRVKRLLTDAEVNEVLQKNGYPVMRRKGGEMNLEDWGFSKDGSLAADNKGEMKFSFDEEGAYFPAPDEWGTAYISMTGKGLQAVEFLLEKQNGFVPAAFNRPEIGDIDIVYGKNGTGIDDKGGYGLAHILKRRGKGHINWQVFADTINDGEFIQVNDSRIYFINKKSKVIVELKFKGIDRKWVVSAMGSDLTSTADSLLASNPTEAAKQGIAPKGLYTIGDVFDKVKQVFENNQEKFTFGELESKTDELHKEALKDGVIRRIAEIAADAFQYFKRKVPNDYMVRTNLCVTA